jgi:hypothetical protein
LIRDAQAVYEHRHKSTKKKRNVEHNLKMSMPSTPSHQGRKQRKFEGSIGYLDEERSSVTKVERGVTPFLSNTEEGILSLSSWLKGRRTIGCRRCSPKLGRVLTQRTIGAETRDTSPKLMKLQS